MADNGLKYKVLYTFLILFLIFYHNKGEVNYTTLWLSPPYLLDDETFKSKNKESPKSTLSENKIVDTKPGENLDPIVEEINNLAEITGLDVTGYEKHTFEVAFYSDLNCENGFGNITATGEVLEDGVIANNFLDFGTKVYIEGLGVKTVKDRGSKKYFYDVSKIDVFVPRNNNESDYEYYERVNSMGRKKVNGYILYFSE